MSSQSTENNPKTNAFKKLDNDSRNYSIWAPRCHMVLQGLELWAIVNPTVPTSVQLTTHPAPIPAPIPAPVPASATPGMPTPGTGSTPTSIPAPVLDAAEWDRKNMKGLSLISTRIDDTPFPLTSMKSTARDPWTTLLIRYKGY